MPSPPLQPTLQPLPTQPALIKYMIVIIQDARKTKGVRDREDTCYLEDTYNLSSELKSQCSFRHGAILFIFKFKE